MQTMTLGETLIQGVSDGRIHAAIWHGCHDVTPGSLRLQSPSGEKAVEVRVTDVRHKPFVEVDEREAQDSGEPDREALWQVLSRNYPDMTHTDEVTVALLA